MERVSAFLKIPQTYVEKSIRMIGPQQSSLLDILARESGVEYSTYLRDQPVYMTTREIEDLIGWGFDIGGHSLDHQNFSSLKEEEMLEQVKMSIDDLIKRFSVNTRYFSFPFTSDGVPAYCQIMSMHWGVNDRETVECEGGDCGADQASCGGKAITYHGHEVVAEVRAFLEFPVHFFAECQAVNAYENTVPNPAWPYLDDAGRMGHYLTTTGTRICDGYSAE